MGVCSLPSVASTFTFQEWRLVFTYLGWAIVIMSFTHVGCSLWNAYVK
jgi:hypothetical protein